MVFDSWILTGSFAVASYFSLNLLRHVSLQKQRSGEGFEDASANFYKHATALMESEEAVPIEVVNVLLRSGKS